MTFLTQRLVPWMIVAGALATTACGKDDGGGGQAAPAKKTPIQVCNERYKDSYDRSSCYETSYQKEIDNCESKNRNDRTRLSTCYDAVEKRYRSVLSSIGGGRFGRDDWRYDRDSDRFGWDDRWMDDRYDDAYFDGNFLIIGRERIDCRREPRTCDDYERRYFTQRPVRPGIGWNFCLGWCP